MEHTVRINLRKRIVAGLIGAALVAGLALSTAIATLGDQDLNLAKGASSVPVGKGGSGGVKWR